MSISLSQLRSFAATAEALNFGRAAEAIGVSQPTVSKEIRRLEGALGVELFDRAAGGTTLTTAGERLRPLAEAVLATVRDFVMAAEVAQRTSRRIVTVAASPSIVNRLLPQALQVVDDQQLDITIRPLEVETGQVLAAVETGRADVGIGHQVGKPTRAHKRTLGQDEMLVVLHRSLRAERNGRANLRRLTNVPLLLWPRENSPIYYDHLMRMCRDRGLEPLVLTGTSRISGSWSFFLKDARAFSLVPRDFAEQEARGQLTALRLDPPAYIPLEVVWNRHSAPEVAKVLEAVVAAAPGQDPSGTERA